MADRAKSSAPPAIGGSSLLVAFAVLALTVFAMLSLSTVRADERLGAASAKAVEDYYAADCRAQEILACLRTGADLPDGAAVESSTARYADRVVETVSYAVPISETQELHVTVTLDGSAYTVLRWQAAPAGQWEIDEDLDIWDGETIWDGELP